MSAGTGEYANDELAKSIFLDALEIVSDAERLAYLDRRCGADHQLRSEVETLLRHGQRLGDYLERPRSIWGRPEISPNPRSPRAPARSSAPTS